MDSVGALPVDESPSPQSHAQLEAPLWKPATVFFIVALVAVAIDGFFLLRSRSVQGGLVLDAAILAAAGLVLGPTIRQGVESGTYSGAIPWLTEEVWCSFAVFAAFLAFYAATSAAPTYFNEHVREAYALLHGHAWVDAPAFMEQVHWEQRTYLLHPPLSAILLMPVVAFWGLSTNQTAVSVILGAVEVALAWRLLGRLGLATEARAWLTMFFGVGTTLWYEVTLGNSWDFALVLSAAVTLAALNEAFGKARPWLVGLLAGLAALARYDLALVSPIYVLLLWVRGRAGRELLWMGPGFALAAAVYVWFNEVRFGTVSDISLWIWYGQDSYRSVHPDGPFSIRYLPFNLYTVLFMAPSYTEQFPFVHPHMMGQAMVLTSPAFVLALRPSFRRPIPVLMALATIIAMMPGLLVYANGFVQFGTRYCVQVFPFLLVLVALGLPRRIDQLTRILILASIAMVAFGFWHIRTLGFESPFPGWPFYRG